MGDNGEKLAHPPIMAETVRPGGRLEVENGLRERLCLLENGQLFVAAAYATDDGVLSYIELLRRARVQFQVVNVPAEVIRGAYKRSESADTGQVIRDRQKRMLEILRAGNDVDASDVHVINSEKDTVIKFRVDGLLQTFRGLRDGMTSADGQALCGALFQGLGETNDGGEYKPRKSQDGRLKPEHANLVGLQGARLASRPTGDGNVVIIRLLKHRQIKGFRDIGFHPSQVPLLDQMVYRRRGAYFVSGPTGSGKTNTLYSVGHHLLEDAKHQINLMTVEDPIELKLPGANQTPLDVDFTAGPEAEAEAWARAAKNCMRLDPDVLIVGEMRNAESANAGIQFALTGHGFWSTLHTDNATQCLDRLKNLGVDKSLLMDHGVLRGLINQSLVPKLCPACKRPFYKVKYALPEATRERVREHCEDTDKVYVAGADRACTECGGTGVKGRLLVAEVVDTTQSMLDVYGTDGAAAARAYWVKHLGGMPKSHHLAYLIEQGLVDPAMGEREVCLLSDDR